MDEHALDGLDPEDVAAHMLAALPTTVKSEWDELIGPCFTGPDLNAWRRTSRQVHHQMRGSGRILAVRTGDGAILYPTFQFAAAPARGAGGAGARNHRPPGPGALVEHLKRRVEREHSGRIAARGGRRTGARPRRSRCSQKTRAVSRKRQGLPSPTAELRAFPSEALDSARRPHRSHRAGVPPHWFSSDGSGRFDLEAPHGRRHDPSRHP